MVRTSVVDAPVDEVFAWHRRPGALRRLLPPWQPVRVVEETRHLGAGRAVLALPGGLRWVAEHDPDGYDPPYLFVDRLASLGKVVSWSHRHELLPDGGRTRVTDRIETSLPSRLVRSMLAYRHRQLADDLAAHHRPYAAGRSLTIAVTGASGTIGQALVPFLTTGGHRVVRLVRHPPTRADERRWSPEEPSPELLAGVDAVCHLAGASIAGRFTEGHKQAVRDSRLGPTRALAEAAARAGVATFVSASAIGLYGADRDGEILTETSERGDGFLAEVVAGWEASTTPAADAGARVVEVRTGIVQTPRGGALRLQRPLFAAGLGGPLRADAWLSWIGIDDLIDVYHRALLDDALAGPVNAVAPAPVSGRDHARALGRALHRPAVLPTPAFGPRLLLGREGADEVALASQRVRPAVLLGLGHPYRFPELEPALRHLLGTAR